MGQAFLVSQTAGYQLDEIYQHSVVQFGAVQAGFAHGVLQAFCRAEFCLDGLLLFAKTRKERSVGYERRKHVTNK